MCTGANAAEAAKNAAANARVEALMKTPLYMHSLKCAATVALILWGDQLHLTSIPQEGR